MQTDVSSRKSFRFTVITLVALIVLALCVGVIIFLFMYKNNLSGTQCNYDAKIYQQGDVFKSTDGCNTCTCGNGNVACTEMACVSVFPTVTPDVTSVVVSGTPGMTPIGTSLQIFFGNPSTESDYDNLVAVIRPTTTTGADQFSFVISQILAGPTTEEQATGLTGVMTLSGVSTCGTSSYQYSRSGSALTLKFCKVINFVQNTGTGGSYAGMSLAANARVYQALSQSLKLDGVTTVVVKQSDNTCFAKDSGVNTVCVD